MLTFFSFFQLNMALSYIQSLRIQLPRIIKGTRTLEIERVPKLFHETGILTGYRPHNQPWSYYLRSFFTLHNESMNVWTHVIGSCVTLYLTYLSCLHGYQNNKFIWPLFVGGLGCAMCTILSTTAHLLHSKSLTAHYNFFMMDYMGVSMYGYALAVIQFHVSCQDQVYHIFEPIFIYINCALSLCVFLGCAFCLLKKDGSLSFKLLLPRLTACLAQTLYGALFIFERTYFCWLDKDCSIVGDLGHQWIQSIVLLLCAVFYASHLPEKIWPGKFDIFGQSHQIFHVFVIVNNIVTFRAAHIDLQRPESVYSHINPDPVGLVAGMIFVLLIEIICVLALQNKVKQAVAKQIKAIKSR